MGNTKSPSAQDKGRLRKNKELLSALKQRKLRGLKPDDLKKRRKLIQDDIVAGRISTLVSAGVSTARGIISGNSTLIMDYDPDDSVIGWDILTTGGDARPDGDGIFIADMNNNTDPA